MTTADTLPHSALAQMLPAQLDSLRAHVASRQPVGAPRDGARAEAGTTVLVVGSGKGGAGTSVVAALLALSAAALGRRVLLADLDEHVGPQRWLLGATPAAPAHGLGALRRGVAPEALLVPVSATLALLPGGPADGADAADAPLAPAERRALLRRAASCFAAHELVVVDAGSRLDTVRAGLETAQAAAQAADGNLAVRLLVVTGSDPIALAASYALVKSVAAGDAPDLPSLPVDVLASRLDDDDARHAFEHLDAAARQFLRQPLRFAGSVPDDASLAVALRAGMPLQDAAAGSPAAIAMQSIATRLALPSPASAARGGRPASTPRAAVPGLVPGDRGLRAAASLAYSGSPQGSAR